MEDAGWLYPTRQSPMPRKLPLADKPARTVRKRRPAQAMAGALFALLRWWLDHDTPYTPEQMDRMFHSI